MSKSPRSNKSRRSRSQPARGSALPGSAVARSAPTAQLASSAPPTSRPPPSATRPLSSSPPGALGVASEPFASEPAGPGRVARLGRLTFPTVGIGASAGGLAALESFLGAVPAGAGVAIVIVTHQHPNHESLLPELLARHSILPVSPIHAGIKLEPNHVYVSPPGKTVALIGGCLQLSDQVRDGSMQLPIDAFFRTLAFDQEDHAICIVLSGTGTDGSLGLRAVKGQGGMAIVQDEASAQYPGMPLSAASTLLADCVMAPADMPERVVSYARDLQRATGAQAAHAQSLSDGMRSVLGLLHLRTGHDFSGYKAPAVTRRIERRMRVHHLELVLDYLALLKSQPHEVELLFSDLLINVTSFFRDAEAFNALESLLGRRLAEHGAGEPALRIWVPGCSTGEEAYSIAILLAELHTRSERRPNAQIFATDIDPVVIDHARLGLYPEGIAVDVGAQRLDRFFVAEGNNYRIHKNIRELCVFAIQSLIRDPPFTKLDVISCRNLLIYLDAATQQRVLPLFHYALKPGGVLLLGSSEAISGFEHLFKPMDRKHKLYERLEHGAESADGAAPSPSRVPWPLAGPIALPPRPAAAPGGIPLLSDKALLQRFCPATLVVNGSGDIAYIHGRTGKYLEPTSGEPKNNLLGMAREGLHGALASALRRANTEEQEVVCKGVQVRNDQAYQSVNITVARLGDNEALRGLFRVSFEPARPEPESGRTGSGKSRPPPAGGQLERELQHTRGALQGSIEELQSSNEELKSMNEELQSTNEELQSSNEELETSKEELQSLNEELQTVNLQLQLKMEELSHANDDMANLLESTDIATVFLDRNLCIKRFTDLAREVISLIPADVGRPVGNLASNLRYDQLTLDAQTVLNTLLPHEVEVQTRQGQWRLVRMIPYRTSKNVIDGVAVTFLDIDRVKRPELLSASRALADSIVNTVHEPLVVLDEFLGIAAANPAFFQTFALNPASTQQPSLFDVGLGVFATAELRMRLHRLLADGIPVESFELCYDSELDGPRHLLVNARRLFGPVTTPCHVLLAINDSARPALLPARAHEE